MALKVTKERANYRDGTDGKRCGLCTMFRPPDSCTAVAGDISAHKLCDYFDRIRPKLYDKDNRDG